MQFPHSINAHSEWSFFGVKEIKNKDEMYRAQWLAKSIDSNV